MGNNFKVKCVKGYSVYTTVGKVYEVVNGVFRYDNGRTAEELCLPIEEMNKRFVSKFELYQEPMEDVKMNGNFKVRCVKSGQRWYTAGKIYEIKEGKITDDDGEEYPINKRLDDLSQLQEYASSHEWELYKEPKLITGESITIRRKKSKVIATLSIDGEFKYSQYIKLVDAGNDFKTAVNMVVERLMDKWDGGNSTDLTASTFDWDGFKQGKFAVHCDTEEKAREFLNECDANGVTWITEHRTARQETRWDIYEKDTCYGFSDGDMRGICYGHFEETKKIDYTPTIIPQPTTQKVSRQAEVGKYIKITNGDRHKAKVGEIYKVESLDGQRFVSIKIESGSMQLISNDQYVIVENPIKKVKRPAKVGEWIEIVDANGCHTARVGDIAQVTSVREEDGVTYYITTTGVKGSGFDRRYLVLENYTPEVTHEVVEIPTSKFVKAKVGDKIKVVKVASFHCSDVAVGQVRNVIDVHRDSVVNTDKDGCCNTFFDEDEEYEIVTETPINPLSTYTQEQLIKELFNRQGL